MERDPNGFTFRRICARKSIPIFIETVSEVAKRKNEIYYEQQLSQKERV